MYAMNVTLEAARSYSRRGWCPIPIPRGEKRPVRQGWQRLRLTEADLPAHFAAACNIGVLLLDGLTDLDLDCVEAVQLADDFLPRTAFVFGRPSKRRSHHFYNSDPLARRRNFRDPLAPKDQATLLEVRAMTGDKGLQTLVPPSLHPSGEPITFDEEGALARVAGPELSRRAAMLAVACLLGRHWPVRGARHEAALALAGFLLRGGVDDSMVERIVAGAARVAGDEEWRARVTNVQTTAQALRDGAPATGGPALGAFFDQKIITTVTAWLDLSNALPTAGRAPADPMPRLDGAMTVLDGGVLAYILRRHESLTVVTSKGDVLDEPLARDRYRLAKTPDIEARLSGAALDAIRRDGITRLDGVKLFEDLRALLARHVEWPSPHVPALLALWVIGTYCFRLFDYFAYIVLGSVAKRSGKSLVEEILAELCFNATPPQANPTPAALYREIDANHATTLLDEIESLTDRDKDDRARVLAILNLGFKATATVVRIEKRGDRLVPMRYSAYSPKVLAGIKRPADTIRDRSIQIRMQRKRRDRKLPRFNVRLLRPILQDLRDRLHLFALATSADVRDLYDSAEHLALPATLDDRARDILEPLYAIAGVIDADTGEAHVTAHLTKAVDALMLDRVDDAGDEATLVCALEALRSRPRNGAGDLVLPSAEAVKLFQAHEQLEWVTEPKHARGLLARLAFRSGSHRVEGKVVRGYKMTSEEIEDLWQRYGPAPEDGAGDTQMGETVSA
jgi:hypothetical protein